MLIDEHGNKVSLILEDGRLISSDTQIQGIKQDKNLNVPIVSEDSFDYVMLTAFKADKDQKLINRVIQVQLDLLKVLKSVCDRYNLKLFMVYGTLLGAVRHEGIIPGDDDIDVALFRDDYDKLIGLADEFSGKFFLQTPDNDNVFWGGYSKLRNRETTALHCQNWWIDCCEGISIDIFPIDGGFTNPFLEFIKEKRVCFYQRLVYAKVYGDARNYLDMPLLIWKGYKYFGKLFSKKHLTDKLRKIFMSGDKSTDSSLAIYTHYTSGKKATKFSRKTFENEIKLKYEDMDLLAPEGYEEMLKAKYGREFMKFPIPDCEPKYRHGFYDVDNSYRQYKKHFDSRFKNLPSGKKLVLVGDPLICNEYLRRYGQVHPAQYMLLFRTVSIDCRKFEHIEYDIQQKSLEEFQQEDLTQVVLFLCGFDYHKLWDLMKEIGCKEYFFFHYDAMWMLASDPEKVARQYIDAIEKEVKYAI